MSATLAALAEFARVSWDDTFEEEVADRYRDMVHRAKEEHDRMKARLAIAEKVIAELRTEHLEEATAPSLVRCHTCRLLLEWDAKGAP